jgi:predicted nucleotidyltransferase
MGMRVEHDDDRAVVAEDVLLHVLDTALAAMEGSGLPFLVMGGIASAILGRPRWTHDVDLFVRLEDVDRALEALAGQGFDCRIVDAHWLAKAVLDDVSVDVISRSARDILLDDEMLRRAIPASFHGREMRLVPPEDLFVMKCLAASEDTPRYWYDALAIAANADLDWDYLRRRARAAGARRVLSALLFAQSMDLVVPDAPVRDLFDLVMNPETSSRDR